MTLTKEWLKHTIAELEEERDAVPGVVNEDAAKALAAMKLALASLEAEPVSVNDDMAYAFHHAISDSSLGSDEVEEIKAGLRAAFANVTAQPAPVSVPDAIHSQGEKSASDDYYALGWNACRAAMLKHSEPFIVTSDHRMMEMPQVEAINAVTAILQGADGTLTNEGTIPVTQFKPVADLYGLTSPTGGETSFTFDAVEARDFIDGGWLCQEYVTLERYQEAITNHTEDKLAMVDHSGDSNNMVEPVTTAYKLRDAVETIRSSGIAIDADKIFAERDVLNSPVIPDGWVACSERMPEDDDFVYIWPRPDFGVELHVAQYGKFDKRDAGWYAQVYEQNYGIEYYPVRVTHWMPLPAAPQQEVK
ncbi:DUF551 domain-containing protein [Enterobacter hormaechei]|uniref:DUF551 domain-containing protein n=1 Tax=Enterobacter hormaechei TaxID=158836 RepID=UPI002012F781|nr:DUF551 domain-containing protein [Enterobacter hormaechei]